MGQKRKFILILVWTRESDCVLISDGIKLNLNEGNKEKENELQMVNVYRALYKVQSILFVMSPPPIFIAQWCLIKETWKH